MIIKDLKNIQSPFVVEGIWEDEEFGTTLYELSILFERTKKRVIIETSEDGVEISDDLIIKKEYGDSESFFELRKKSDIVEILYYKFKNSKNNTIGFLKFKIKDKKSDIIEMFYNIRVSNSISKNGVKDSDRIFSSYKKDFDIYSFKDKVFSKKKADLIENIKNKFKNSKTITKKGL